MIGAYPIGVVPVASGVGRLATLDAAVAIEAQSTVAIVATRTPGFGITSTNTATVTITLRKMWDGEAANAETWWDNRADETAWTDAAANAETWSDA